MMMSFTTLDVCHPSRRGVMARMTHARDRTSVQARNEPLYALRRDCNFVALCKDASLFASPKRGHSTPPMMVMWMAYDESPLSLSLSEFEWEDGDETLSCHLCGAAFTIIRRRHRCRACE